jgi:peptidoglycan/LPS O-acetylase OafA/YrhL
MDTTRAAGNEIRPLTGLRGVAALTVAFGHYHVGTYFPLFLIFYWKNAAVDLFFCLSGFTLCLAYHAGISPRLPIRAFLVARIARIYPLYLLTLLASGLMINYPIFSNNSTLHAEQLLFIRQLLMVNSWFSLGSGQHWNVPAWSVSVEIFCYIFIFPILFYLFHFLSRIDWRMRALISTLSMAVSYFVYARYFDQRVVLFGRNPYTLLPDFASSVNATRGILGFLAGWLIYASYFHKDRFFEIASRYADAVALAFIGLLVLGALDIVSFQISIVIFPILILGVSSGSSFSGRFLSSEPIHYLGKISYSIYMLHMPWFYLGFTHDKIFGFAPPDKAVYYVTIISGMLIASGLSYHLVEMPSRRLIRGMFQPNPEGAPAFDGRRLLARCAIAGSVLALAGAEAGQTHLLSPTSPPLVKFGDDIVLPQIFGPAAGANWSAREPWGIWSIGKEATLDVAIDDAPRENVRLLVKGWVFLGPGHPSTTARITVNGVEIGKLTPTLTDSRIETALDVPSAVLTARGGRLEIGISVDDPVSPQSLGMSTDTRQLGFGLISMKLIEGGSHS